MSNAQGEPMFCAKDVALGYKRPEDAMAQHLEIEDSVKHRVMDRNGKLRVTTFINESGLYSLILSSKLESAKRFKRWVTGEVLPTIRKQGGYLMAKQGENEKDIMIRALESCRPRFNDATRKSPVCSPRRTTRTTCWTP